MSKECSVKFRYTQLHLKARQSSRPRSIHGCLVRDFNGHLFQNRIGCEFTKTRFLSYDGFGFNRLRAGEF